MTGVRRRNRPPRPEINFDHQSFRETQVNTYRLSFRWEQTEAPCWPNLEYEVQRRLYVYESRNDGYWDYWEEAVSYQAGEGVDGRRTFDFSGAKNYQLRVRSRNAHGWSPWAEP